MDQRRASGISSVVRGIVGTAILMIPPKVATGVSVSEVKISQDLQYADVLVSAITGLEAALQQLNGQKKQMRKELAKKLPTFTVPVLRFKGDTRGEELSKLDLLLSSLS